MEFRRKGAFQKALRKLGSLAEARVDTKLAQFETDVNGGASLQHLWDVYEYKPLDGPEAKVAAGSLRGQVHQVRPLYDYRVLMLVMTVGDTTHYLHTWRKAGKSDPDHIRRGCALGQSLIELLAKETGSGG